MCRETWGWLGGCTKHTPATAEFKLKREAASPLVPSAHLAAKPLGLWRCLQHDPDLVCRHPAFHHLQLQSRGSIRDPDLVPVHGSLLKAREKDALRRGCSPVGMKSCWRLFR
jgi:hypothetical protein